MGFWAFIFWVVVQIGLAYAISHLTKTKMEMPKIEPDSLDMPTTRESKRYTVVSGTAWIENPIVAWWGNVKIEEIRDFYRKWDWSQFRQKKVYYTTGYRYYVGVHLILCQGQVDGVKQMKVADKLIWPDPDDPASLQADGATSATINLSNLFGGAYETSGPYRFTFDINGTIDFEYGEDSQGQNDYLVGVLGSGISATRGVTAAVQRQIYFGMTPYPEPWRFLLKRTDIHTDGSTQWYSAKADVGEQMNAAHMLREYYTNEQWGLDKSAGLFPAATWEGAADTLYTEGFGLMKKWEDDSETAEDVINEILRHIDGLIYQDPSNGEFILKLIRNDYDLGSLEEFDESDFLSLSDYVRPAVFEAPDSVWVKYWNLTDNKPVSIPCQDIALRDAQGGKQVPLEVSYLMVTDDDLAAKLASRELRQATSFAATMKIKAKRTMSHLRPGDVFKLTAPTHGITAMVVRIISINYGTLNDGYVTLNCAQDVFNMETAIFSTPPASGWTSPYNEPSAETDRLLAETPFWDIMVSTGLSGALALDDDSGFLMVAACKPTNDAIDFELMMRYSPSADFYSDGRGNFTPNGTLTADMPKDADDIVLTLANVQNLSIVEVGSYAVVDAEIVKVKAVDSGSNQVTVARGCLDTVPEAHSGPDSAGANADRIWFAEISSYIAGREFTATDQPGVKILPRTPKGQLAEGDATARNADVFDSRMVRPYPPGDFKVNEVSYPSSFSGQPTISWAHRDRTQQIEEIIEHDAVGIGPEDGTTYTLKIYDENNVLVRTVTDLSGTSYTYQWEDEMDDCGLGSGDPLNTQLRFVLYSVRDGYDSWQSYDVTVARV